MATTAESGASTKLLLSADELAEVLDIGVRTLWRMDACGKLPRPVSIGRLRKWRRREIEAWVEAGCPDRADWDLLREGWK